MGGDVQQASARRHIQSMSSKAQPKITGFSDDLSLPPAAQAAGLTLAILAKAKAKDWAELCSRVRNRNADSTTRDALAKVYLTPYQQQLLAEHTEIVNLVSPGPPALNIVVCDGCHQHMASAKTKLSGCLLTRGCTGTLVSAKRCTQVTRTASEWESLAQEQDTAAQAPDQSDDEVDDEVDGAETDSDQDDDDADHGWTSDGDDIPWSDEPPTWDEGR